MPKLATIFLFSTSFQGETHSKTALYFISRTPYMIELHIAATYPLSYTDIEYGIPSYKKWTNVEGTEFRFHTSL